MNILLCRNESARTMLDQLSWKEFVGDGQLKWFGHVKINV